MASFFSSPHLFQTVWNASSKHSSTCHVRPFKSVSRCQTNEIPRTTTRNTTQPDWPRKCSAPGGQQAASPLLSEMGKHCEFSIHINNHKYIIIYNLYSVIEIQWNPNSQPLHHSSSNTALAAIKKTTTVRAAELWRHISSGCWGKRHQAFSRTMR